MDYITLNANAKINLFLEVCEKRTDSYHNIDSIMQSVSLCDVVTVKKDNVITVNNNANLPNDNKNIAYRAAQSFFEYTNINGGANIFIDKKIPIAAGLAGGSTNAAAVLKALDVLYATSLGYDKLCEIGAKLGADIPFCILGGTYIAKGIGDKLSKCFPMPKCYIIISKCGEGVSTPYAYCEIDKMRETSQYNLLNSSPLARSLERNEIDIIYSNMFNRFEEIVSAVRPMVNTQKNIMMDYGADFSMMSGSGPSVFGIFKNKDKAEACVEKLKMTGAAAFICTPVNN